jgi:type II secretory pathway pseudopilin PulG
VTDTPPSEPTLLDQVGRLTVAVDRATDAVETETRVRVAETEALRLKFFTARRAMRLTVAAMIVGFLVNLGLLALINWQGDQRERERTSSAVVSCLNANESRASINQRFEQLITQLGAANAPSDPTAAAARQQLIGRFLAEFQASTPAALQPRDCSPEAATSPTLVEKR